MAYLVCLCLFDFINHFEFPIKSLVEQIAVGQRWVETVKQFL
jgi:hypothetical protein